jgi:hypothetical protein
MAIELSLIIVDGMDQNLEKIRTPSDASQDSVIEASKTLQGKQLATTHTIETESPTQDQRTLLALWRVEKYSTADNWDIYPMGVFISRRIGHLSNASQSWTLGIDKCLGFDQIFGHLQIQEALIDSATDLKKHPFFLNVARCYQMLVSLRNTLGLLQWGTLNEMPSFIEFVMRLVQV